MQQPAPWGWTIIAQREDFRPGPTGAFTSGMVVTFQLPDGSTGSVFVPEASYTPEAVRAAVNAKAAAMVAVAQLGG